MIETPRLLLRDWRDSDVDALYEIYADPEVERQLVPMTYEQTREQVERFRARWVEEDCSLWAVEERATGRFVGRIGCMRAHEWPLSHHPVEVGWALARDVWGRGYATEGGRASLGWAWEHLDVDEIVSFTRVTNAASRRVMAKLGLTERGTTGYKGIPHVWYAIPRPTPHPIPRPISR